jgi:branched-chain amino acid aminotransferase
VAGIAWVNGALLAPEQAAVSPLDRGFLYGEGLFETMRAYRGRVFRLGRHLGRLMASAREVGLLVPPRELLERAVAEALAAGGLSDAVVRLTVTAGTGGGAPPTVVALVRPLTLPPPERYAAGCRAVSVPVAQVPKCALRRAKSLNYLDKLLAQRAAEAQGGHEAILIDADGCVAEAAMRNVFAVIAGELVTPPLSRGILAGITREAVLEVAHRQSLSCTERDLMLAELVEADECFLTSSVAELLPVASVDGRAVGEGAPGEVTKRLTQAYRLLTAEELGLDLKRSG